MNKSTSKPVADPAFRAPAPKPVIFKFTDKPATGVHTISKSADGQKKMIVVIGKDGKKLTSRTYHLRKRDGNWCGIQGYKVSNDGILIPTRRSF